LVSLFVFPAPPLFCTRVLTHIVLSRAPVLQLPTLLESGSFVVLPGPFLFDLLFVHRGFFFSFYLPCTIDLPLPCGQGRRRSLVILLGHLSKRHCSNLRTMVDPYPSLSGRCFGVPPPFVFASRAFFLPGAQCREIVPVREHILPVLFFFPNTHPPAIVTLL